MAGKMQENSRQVTIILPQIAADSPMLRRFYRIMADEKRNSVDTRELYSKHTTYICLDYMVFIESIDYYKDRMDRISWINICSIHKKIDKLIEKFPSYICWDIVSHNSNLSSYVALKNISKINWTNCIHSNFRNIGKLQMIYKGLPTDIWDSALENILYCMRCPDVSFNQKFLETFIDGINWTALLTNRRFKFPANTAEIAVNSRRFAEINWHSVSKSPGSFDVIDQFPGCLKPIIEYRDRQYLYRYLTVSQIVKYWPYLNVKFIVTETDINVYLHKKVRQIFINDPMYWEALSGVNLPEDRIEEFANYLDWDIMYKKGILSEQFAAKHIARFDPMMIIKYANLGRALQVEMQNLQIL